MVEARFRGDSPEAIARKHIFWHHVPGGGIVNRAFATVAAGNPSVHVLDIDGSGDPPDNEPDFDAWSCTFRNIHLGSKAFHERTRLIFDACIPGARIDDFLPCTH